MNISNPKNHYHSLSRPVMLLFFLFLLIGFCSCTNTITPNKPLSDGHVLVSTDENFALGFFSPANSSRRYVGIWYNKISPQTVVWVGNRDNPITNTSGVLSVNKSGNVVLFYSENPSVHVWSTNLSVVESNYSAQLLGSGNFVVFQNDNTEGSFVWQSFDFQTDTQLPNMKLGLDRRSGFRRSMTSWKSPDDPGTGSFSLMIDVVNGSLPQLFLYKNLDPYWRGGSWNGLSWTGVPEMLRSTILNKTYIDNPEEVSIVFGVVNASIITRLVLNEITGTVERLNWHESDHKWFSFWFAPGDKCDNFNHCGAYGNCNIYNTSTEYECSCLPGFEPKSPQDWDSRDPSEGCVRKRGGQVCGNGEGFVKVSGVKLPDTTKTQVDMNLSRKACDELCLKDCSCTGYSSADVSRGGFNGCITWYGQLLDLRTYTSGGQDLYVRVDAVELAEHSKKASKGSHGYIKVLLLVLLIPAILVLITLAYWLIMKKKRGRDQGRQKNILLFSSSDSSSTGSALGEEHNEMGSSTMGSSTVDLKLYSLSTIIAATEDFSDSNKVGAGGFGSVYKGKLQNGHEIAVKRLSNTSGQGIEEFTNEVTLIAKLQHRNLVKLLGYCIQKEEKVLIYEYLPNKGLDCFLFDKEKRYIMDWRERFDIVLGIARGMVYLHHDSRLRIIHRDLKASNVLLDAHLNPKISDFGMARIFGGNQIEGRTRRVVGTYGYMSPEYAMEGLFSIKSDVFSFGVLLLEIITGRRNSSYYVENSVNLIGHGIKVLEIVDPSLGESNQHESEILRCIHIGLLSVQESAQARPSMSEVIFMLCNETSLPTPGEAIFIARTSNRDQTNTSSTNLGAISINEVTISMVEGR